MRADPASLPECDQLRETAAHLIEEEFAGAPVIVLKDPRICRLVPFWLDALAQSRYRPVPIVTFRDPFEVAQSLRKRNGFPLSFGLLLWLRYVLEAERLTRGLSRVVTSYDDVLSNWRAVVGMIAERGKVTFPHSLDDAAPEVEAFLSEELRTFAAPPEGDPPHARLSSYVRDVFDILRRWTLSGEDQSDHAALDRLGAILDEASWTFVDAARAVTGRTEALDAALRSANRRAGALQDQAVAETRRREVVERLLADAQIGLEQASLRSHCLADENDRQVRELGLLARRLKDANELRSGMQREISELQDRLQAVDAQLGAANRAIEEADERYRTLIASTSWRLTAPMRRVVDRLRGTGGMT